VGRSYEKVKCLEWHKQFKDGRENVEGAERNHSPRSHRTDENVEEVRNLMQKDRYLSIRSMALQLNLDKEIAIQILNA
jgi:hypothetical protein